MRLLVLKNASQDTAMQFKPNLLLIVTKGRHAVQLSKEASSSHILL